MSTNEASQTKEQCLQECANIHRKAFAKWYYKTSRSLRITRDGRWEMQSLLQLSRTPYPIKRADLRPDTISALELWESKPLVPGTPEHQSARVRTLRDVIFDKLQGSETADEELAALKPTNFEMSDAHQWLYVTTDGQYAKHRPYKQPFFYKELARDGVSTLPPQSSPDNDFSNEAEPQPQKVAKFPRDRQVRVGADLRFNPYARLPQPGRRGKKKSRHAMRKDMKGSDADSIREAAPTSTATRSAATDEEAPTKPPEPIKFTNLAIRVIDRGLSGAGSEGNASYSIGHNEGSHKGTMRNAATNQGPSPEPPKSIQFTNLAIRVIDRGLSGAGSEGNASNSIGYDESSHDDVL
ncbi:MAG: hypothetical protein Q9226_002874 [Calogaya cf. arnoldii]